VPCYQPLGNLLLKFDGAGEVSDYLRELGLRDAVAKVHYRQNEIGFDREVFVSHPDDATIIRLHADKAGSLNFQVTLDSQHPTARLKTLATNEFVMTGQLPGFALRRTLEYVEEHSEQWKYPELWNKDGSRKSNAKQLLYGAEADDRGMRFEARVRVLKCDGKVTSTGTGLKIESAQEVVLVLAVASSFNGFDKSPAGKASNPLLEPCRCSKGLTANPTSSFATRMWPTTNNYSTAFRST